MQTGSTPVQWPLRQSRLCSPTTWYPCGQEYEALPPNSRPEIVTVPSSGDGISGHSRSNNEKWLKCQLNDFRKQNENPWDFSLQQDMYLVLCMTCRRVRHISTSSFCFCSLHPTSICANIFGRAMWLALHREDTQWMVNFVDFYKCDCHHQLLQNPRPRQIHPRLHQLVLWPLPQELTVLKINFIILNFLQ